MEDMPFRMETRPIGQPHPDDVDDIVSVAAVFAAWATLVAPSETIITERRCVVVDRTWIVPLRTTLHVVPLEIAAVAANVPTVTFVDPNRKPGRIARDDPDELTYVTAAVNSMTSPAAHTGSVTALSSIGVFVPSVPQPDAASVTAVCAPSDATWVRSPPPAAAAHLTPAVSAESTVRT